MPSTIKLLATPSFPFPTPTTSPSPLSFSVADLHDLEWLLNHTGTPTAWVSRPDLQHPGVGQYNLPARPRPRPNQSLYVHPYCRPTLGSSNPPARPPPSRPLEGTGSGINRKTPYPTTPSA
jgi:hypothetical protein